MRPSVMEHDPEVCGIFRDMSCPACQAAWDKATAPPSAADAVAERANELKRRRDKQRIGGR